MKGSRSGVIALFCVVVAILTIRAFAEENPQKRIQEANDKIFFAQQAVDFLTFDLERDEAFSGMVMNRTTLEEIRRHKEANLPVREKVLANLEAYPSDFSEPIRILSQGIEKDRQILSMSPRFGKSLQIARNDLLEGIAQKREALSILRSKIEALRADLERMIEAVRTGKGGD